METQKDKKLEASKYAYDTLLSAFASVASKNQLSEDIIMAFKKVLSDVYTEKKANNFVENKLDKMTDYIDELVLLTMLGQKEDKEESSNSFMYRTKKLVSYE